jgi:hypothetical protein
MKTTSCASARPWRRAESGYTVTVQAVYYISLLFLFFALIYDFGNAGYIYTITSNAARLAAQDAAKNIDEEAFFNDQEIRLNEDALTRAQAVADGITGGRMTVNTVEISRLAERDVIVVRGQAVVDLPVLGAVLGLTSVTIGVDGYAEPAYGINEEGQ